MTPIAHADQLTRSEFGKLMKRTTVRVLIASFTVAIGVFFGLAGGPIAAAVGAILALAAGLGLTWVQAGTRAEKAFHKAYAKSRGLSPLNRGIGRATPLLRKGDKQVTEAMFSGQLNEQFKGSLALYTYIEVTRDAKGNEVNNPHPFTVVTMQLPEVAAHLSDLVVEKQAGLRSLERLEDAFRGNLVRVRLESQALDDRFEIFAKKDQDPIWLRRLFSPSFIVWLSDHPVDDFAFEFGQGTLCAYVPKHRESDEGFDQMIRESCELAQRLRDEALEAAGQS